MNSIFKHLAHKISVYIMIGLLGSLMAFYYFVFIPKNEQQINEHAARLLNNKANTVREKYNGYRAAIKTSPEAYFYHWAITVRKLDDLWVRRDTSTDTVFFSRNIKNEESANESVTNRKETISKKLTRKNGLQRVPNNPSQINSLQHITKQELKEAAIDPTFKPELRGPQHKPGLDVWQVTTGNNYFVYDIDGKYYDLDSNKLITPYLWVFVGGFMSHLKSNDFFDDIFLVSIQDHKDSSSSSSSGFIPDGAVLDNSNLGLVRFLIPDSIRKFGTGFFNKDIEGQTYKAYVKRVQLRQGLNVHVVGLVGESKLHHQGREVPAWFLVFCLLLALLLFFLLPVIKLFSLNKHERLAAIDARLSVFSMVLGVSMTTIIFFGSYIFWSLETRHAEKTMENLAEKIRKSTIDEIQRLNSILDDPTLFLAGSASERLGNLKNRHSSLTRFNEIFSLSTKENSEGLVKDVFNDRGNDFKHQKFPITIKGRDYFTNVKEAIKNGVEIDYWIDPINSFTTVHSEVGVSKYHKEDSTIRVITSRMPSVISAIIPTPYRFVVVNRSGDIKFHSEWKELQKENFIHECNEDPDLDAYIRNSVHGLLEFTYLGNDCSGYGLPLIKDLYLIVFFEQSTIRNMAAEIFGLCLMTLAVVIIIMGFIHLLLSLDHPRSTLLKTRSFFYHWLNPQVCSQEIGLKLSLFCFLLFVGEMIFSWFFYSTVASILFVGLNVTLFYWVCYGSLNGDGNRKYSKAKKGLLILIWIWAATLTVFTISIGYGWQWHCVAFYIGGCYLIFRFGTLEKLGEKLRPFLVYRFFLVGSLLVLAVGPSIIFISTHYYFSSLSTQHRYNVEDVFKLQTRTVKDNKDYCGNIYSENAKSKIATKNEDVDSTFYTSLQKIQTAKSFEGVWLRHLPNGKDYWLSHNQDSAVIKAIPSLLKSETAVQINDKNAIHLWRKIQKLKFVSNSSAIYVVMAALLAMYGLWKIVSILPRKIFFAPERIIWECYGEQKEKNFLQREFEDSLEQRHPLFKFDEDIRNKWLNESEVKNIEGDRPYVQQLIRDKYILKLQTAAKTIYDSVWTECSNEEKHFLYDLASEGIANQSDQVLIGNLAERGLLRLKPRLELVNYSFANYVMNAMTDEELKQWRESEAEDGNWSNLRLILITLIVAVFVFLSVAEDDFLGRVNTLVASLGLVLPQLVNMFSSFGSLFKRA